MFDDIKCWHEYKTSGDLIHSTGSANEQTNLLGKLLELFQKAKIHLLLDSEISCLCTGIRELKYLFGKILV